MTSTPFISARAISLTLLSLTLTIGAAAHGSAATQADHPIAGRIKAIEAQQDADYEQGGLPLVNRNVLAAAEALIREFPDRPEPFALIADVAFSEEDAVARELFTRVRNSTATSERGKSLAASQLARLDRVGQPLALQFTALDGQPFDVAAQRGKVVVIDWWATWCPPCVKDLPHFKEVVARYAPRGVVFVGISLDQKRDKLEAFLREHAVTWPQFFDGQGWKNRLASEFAIRSVPSVWLVDREGVLRDTFGRADLEKKLDRLLAP